MNKIYPVLVALILFMACDKGESRVDKTSELKPYDFNYKTYSQVLKGFISDGRVDYSKLKENRLQLDQLVESIETADLSQATHDQKLAFYINAYNILTIRAIVDAYPVKSIKDIDGVWDKKEWPVAGQKMTLNDIEHNILRKKFDEPRMHFAIVCASRSCPPIQSEPYLPQTIDELLAIASEKFATDDYYNKVNPEKGTAEISPIFDWYGEDFIDKYYTDERFQDLSKKNNAALNFLILQFPAEKQKELFDAEYKISYGEYDWNLNDIR